MEKNIPKNQIRTESTNSKSNVSSSASGKKYAKLLADLAIDFQSLNWVKENFYFILFVFAVGLVYIANSHFAEKQTRRMEALSNEIKELKSEAMTINAQLCRIKKQSELSKRLEDKGIKALKDIPFKVVNKTSDPSNKNRKQ
jgi:uncharacterized protein YfeS